VIAVALVVPSNCPTVCPVDDEPAATPPEFTANAWLNLVPSPSEPNPVIEDPLQIVA